MSRAVVLSDMFCHYKAPESFYASNLFLPWKKLTNPSNAQLKIIPNKCIIYSRRVTFTENDILSKKINANLCRLSRPVCWQSFTFICVTGRCTILTLYHILLACFFLPDLHIRRWRGLRWSSARRLPSQWPRFKTVFQLWTISCCVRGEQVFLNLSKWF